MGRLWMTMTMATAIGAAALAAGCGGGSGTASTSTTATTPTSPSTQSNVPTAPKSATETNPNAPDYKIGNRPGGPVQTAVIRSFQTWIKALNARNGERVCSLLTPAGTYNLHLPAKRESCAEGVNASIGHPGPGGLVWRSAHVVGGASVYTDVSALTAKLAVAVLSTYKGGKRLREKETVILHETPPGALCARCRWRLAKPDGTFYRAVGIGGE